MKVPSNLSEGAVLDVIKNVVTLLAPSFRFGCYDVDDLKQEATMFAIRAMDKYDENRPLANFIYSHVRNRLINFKRDNYRRTDSPCPACYQADANGRKPSHEGETFCVKYAHWRKRNVCKQNLMNTLDIGNLNDEGESTTHRESTIVEDIHLKELLDKIDMQLPVEMRSIYLQLKDGVSVPKSKRSEVECKLKEILGIEI